MEVVKSRQRPRCAVCGSSAVTLRGACVWHLPGQSWHREDAVGVKFVRG